MTIRKIIIWVLIIALGGAYFIYSYYQNPINRVNNETVSVEKKEKLKKILAIGDSLTAGYGLEDPTDSYPSQLQQKLQQSGYNYEVINAGVSGDTSKGVLNRLDFVLDGNVDIDLAILVVGANDGFRSQSLDELESNIEAILSKLQDKNIKVIFGGMMLPPNYGLKYSNEFNALYPKIAANNDVYFYEFFLQGVAAKSEFNLKDKIHPNKDGYEIIVGKLFEFMEQRNLIFK